MPNPDISRAFAKTHQFHALENPGFWIPRNVRWGFVHAGMTAYALDDTLQEIRQSLKGRKDPSSPGLEALLSQLMRNVEVLCVIFPELYEQEWFADCEQAIVYVYWRWNEGRFRDHSESLEEFMREMMEHFEGPPGRNFSSLLHQFLEFGGPNIPVENVPTDYEGDMNEALNLLHIGYPSTALLVLGRAVERVITEIGGMRKIGKLNLGQRKFAWAEASFSLKTRAMREVPSAMHAGPVFNRPRFAEAVILLDHRNRLAHSEYANHDSGEVQRGLTNAYGLLGVLFSERAATLQKKRHKPIAEILLENPDYI